MHGDLGCGNQAAGSRVPRHPNECLSFIRHACDSGHPGGFAGFPRAREWRPPGTKGHFSLGSGAEDLKSCQNRRLCG